MNWEKTEDGSWKVTPITVEEEKFLDALFAMLTAREALEPRYYATNGKKRGNENPHKMRTVVIPSTKSYFDDLNDMLRAEDSH